MIGIIAVLTSGKIDYIAKNKKWEFQYIFHQIDIGEYYEKSGYGYEVAAYIEEHLSGQKIINHGDSLPIFLKKNAYVPFTYDPFIHEGELNWEMVCPFLQEKNIASLVHYGDREGVNTYWSDNVGGGYYRDHIDNFEAIIIDHSTILFDKNGRKLYQIKFDCIRP